MKTDILKTFFSRKTMTISQRIILVILILMGLGIGTLKLAERSPEPLRKGFQDYLAQATGQYAEITDIEKVKMFPQMDLSFNGVLLRDQKDMEHILVKAGKVQISIPFWKAFLGMRHYSAVNIANTDIASGFVFPQKIAITHALISDGGDIAEAPVFVTEGRYAGKDFLLTADMKRHEDTPPYEYSFNRHIPVSFKLGDLEARAVYSVKKDGGQLSDAELSLDQHTALLTIRKIKTKPAGFEASGTIDGTAVNAVLTGSPSEYKLRISVQEDAKEKNAKLEAFAASLNHILGYSGKDKAKQFVIVDPPSDPSLKKTQQTENKSKK